MSKRLFVSCVSDEFRSLRADLRLYLTRADCEVKVQEEFRQTPEDTVEKLDGYIRQCQAVIHLVGEQAGAIADSRAVAAFLKSNPDFLSSHPDLLGQLGDCTDLTYTQWEAFLALHRGVPLFVYKKPEAASHAGQQTHLDRLKLGRRHADAFSGKDDLLGKLIGDLAQIVRIEKIERKLAPSRILRHSPTHLFGREKWLDALDAAWEAKDETNIYTLVAWGGVGKTSLVAHWVSERMNKRGWPGVERYYDWSFYSQGTGESRQTSSDLFIDQALRFFDDPDPTAGSPWERGQRLAGLVRKYRTLLVLDGIEPLQYPINDSSGQAGMLKDQAVEALLLGLAADNPGLCVVTTRETLTNLRTYHNSTAPELKLDKLLREAAIALLRHLQIVGTEEELEAAWEDAGGHALTLQLLGRFIVDAYPDRDIRHRAEVKFEAADRERQGRSAFKVMLAYERWLQSAGEERQRELAILRLTGLFDRPVSADCLSALRAAPAIPGLTDTIVPLTDAQWNIALKRLFSIDLISTSSALDSQPSTLDSLDAHPLIREYFAVQLRDHQPEAFRAAHSRLFDHLCETVKPDQPDTLDGLQPLYQAVVHGCLAQRQQEAVDEVYIDRILRGMGPGGFYSSKKLGAIGADLAAVAAFFDQPWSHLSPNLSEAAQAWLLNEAAFRLRALGRLTEALEPMRVSWEMCEQMKDWKEAAIRGSNLSELEATLGRLGESVADARRAIDLADRSGDAFQRIVNRVTAADALHHVGSVKGEEGSVKGYEEACALFAEAERMQRERQPEFDLLYSLLGFRYCDLLLAPAERAAWQSHHAPRDESFLGELSTKQTEIPTQGGVGKAHHAERDGYFNALAEVERRGEKMFEWRLPDDSILDIALDHLTLARVTLYHAILEQTNPPSEIRLPQYENPHLASALNGLRQAGTSHHIPKALLTSALHHHVTGDDEAARRELDEVQQIAERGPMPLYLADVHLHRARLFRDKSELATARKLIEAHSYGRRCEELADAEAAAQDW